MTKFLFIFLIGFAFLKSAWSQTQNDTIFNFKSETPVIIDGQATEDCWANAEWHAIDQVWIPWNATMKTGDFNGRFKVSWDENYLYVLVEVVDDSLSDDHSNLLQDWWNDDCLEIFVDENRSKGNHERNCNAFAYHISLFYDAVDLNSSGQGVNYKNNIEVDMDTIGVNTYLWEFAVKNYNATFNLNNPEASRVFLEHNKKMGFAIAYCDNDESTTRENFIGSMKMTSATANEMYRNADYFGLMLLVDPKNTTDVVVNEQNLNVKIFPVPAQNHIIIQTPSKDQNRKTVTICTLSGEVVLNEIFYTNKHTINVNKLSEGLYIMKVFQGNRSVSQKIVIQ